MAFFINWLTGIRAFFSKSIFPALISSLAGCILLVLFSGQTPSKPPSNVDQYLRKGLQLWEQADYDSAYVYFRKAQSETDIEEDPATWASATRLSGRYLANQMRFEEAERTLDSVVALSGTIKPQHPAIILARLERAYMDLTRNKLAEALDRSQKIVADCDSLPDIADSLRAMSYESLGQVFFYHGKFEEGRAKVEEALGLYKATFEKTDPRVAGCMNTLGGVNLFMGDYDKSLEYYLEASDLLAKRLGAAHPEALKVKANIGVVYSEQGLFWESLDYHKQTLVHIDSLPPLAHLNCLLNLGATLTALGDYDKALGYLDQAENWMKGFPDMRPDNYAFIDLQRSVIYQELDQSEQAIHFIQKALKQNQAIYGPDHPELMPDYLQIGRLMIKAEKYDSAIVAFRKVIALADEYLEANSLRRGHAFQLLGETYVLKKDHEEGLFYFREAYNTYRRNSNPFAQAKSSIAMAGTWRELGNWDSTFVHLRLAWNILLPEEEFQFSPDAKLLHYWALHPMADLLTEQGLSLHEYFKSNANPDYLRAALVSYESTLSLVDSQRHYYETSGSKQMGVHYQLPNYEAAIEIAIELYTLTGERSYAEKAFLLAEKSKAGNLRDHLRGIEALHFAGIPDSLISKERYYRQRLSAFDQSTINEKGDSTQSEQREAYFVLQQDYRTFLHRLEKNYPQYYQLKYPDQALSVAAMSSYLQEEQALYSYFWGEEKVFVFRLFQGELSCYLIPGDGKITETLTQWLDFISRPPDKDMNGMDQLASVGHQLKQSFLPDLQENIQQIVLIPDGLLGYLPFESLLSDSPGSGSYRDWPWLARERSFNYAYAGELWIQQQLHQDKERNASYLGFAPEFTEGDPIASRAGLGALSFNQEEVQQVAKMLKGTALTGQQAREEAVKKLGKRPRILHFATHAIAEDERMMHSRLYFAGDSASGEDAILNAYEIYGLELNSPLTVLSACQTGKGPLLRGEGIMSLARAFQFVGSRRVLTTLWKTDDRAGAALTTDFFKALAEGTPSENALQKARQNWLAQSDNYHSHPYFWSGFVLIGDGGPVAIKQSGSYLGLLLGIGSIVLLTGLFLFFRKRK